MVRRKHSDLAKFALQRQVKPLYQQLAEIIGQKIATGELAPGEWLPPELELASSLGVSRPSLREGLKILQALGVVSIRHGNGIQVATASADEIARRLAPAPALPPVELGALFEMRETLECQAATWAAQRASDQAIATLRCLVDEMTQMVESRDAADLQFLVDNLARLDKAFHSQLALSTENAALIGLMDRVMGMIGETMRYSLAIPGRPIQSVYDHRRIFQAVAARKPMAAAQAMFLHIDSVHRSVFRRREKGGQPGQPQADPELADDTLLVFTTRRRLNRPQAVPD